MDIFQQQSNKKAVNGKGTTTFGFCLEKDANREGELSFCINLGDIVSVLIHTFEFKPCILELNI